MNNTKELSKNKWRSILSNFIDSKMLDGNHHPCPLCSDGKDRFRFDDKDGTGSYICGVCGAGSGIHLLAQHQGISYKEAWGIVEKYIGTATETKPRPAIDREARIKNILDSCVPVVEHDDVYRYLYSRGIDNIPPSIKKSIAKNGATMMVVKFSRSNKLVGLHITFIRDGKKDNCDSAKKMYGLTNGGLNGSAIRLHPVNETAHIIVAEGVETALSASKIFGYPAWATGSAGLMESLDVPKEITHVTIAADNDASFTGQAAAYALAKKLTLTGHIVDVKIPQNIGDDWNDEL